jgi:hypothetical protein
MNELFTLLEKHEVTLTTGTFGGAMTYFLQKGTAQVCFEIKGSWSVRGAMHEYFYPAICALERSFHSSGEKI